MRVVVNEFMTLDGVVQAPGGAEEDTDGGFLHGGWSVPYFDGEMMGPVIAEGMDTVEALLFGRRTWQGMAAAWPERAGDPYADQMNAIRKYVVGGGKRIFSEDGTARPMRLVKCLTAGTGAQICTYHPAS
jgi:dihydrofolate reductase